MVAKLDTTATPTRLIAVDKTALPAGSSVNTLTGAVTTPLGVTVTGIAGVTKNLAVFANAGQFSVSGSSLIINTGLIAQPAVGVVDSYVVTANNFGGGTTLITVLVSHGSVKIDSITVGAGDVTAPTTTVAPAVSAITATGTTLYVTINENGTGYYLVQAAAAAAPNVAAVQAGISFAMTANVAATPAISGLAASTAYKVYFIAKDTAGNVQAAVQNVAVTTAAGADVTPPTTSAAPSISTAATDTTAGVSQMVNENATGYYLVLPVASAAPSAAAVLAGTSFAMSANTAAVVNLGGLAPSTAYKYYFIAKDAANNVQAAVSAGLAITTTATVDVTPPPVPATLTLTGNAGASAGYTNTQSIALAVAAVADPSGVSWFVSESSSAPVVGDAGWSSTQPTSFTLSAGDGAKNVYVYVKDNVGNLQATGKTVSIALDATVPTITSLPDFGSGADSGATILGKSVTFGDTAGGTPKVNSITANNGASITGFTSGAYGAATFNLVAPVNNTAASITVTLTYSVTDNAGNLTTLTQDVSVAPAI